MSNSLSPSLRGAKRRSNPAFSIVAKRKLDCFASLAMTWMGMRPHSRDSISPELLHFVAPLPKRGRRESRALTAPVDPVRRSTRASRVPKHTGTHYRYSRDIPTFPAQWLYDLLRALPGERR